MPTVNATLLAPPSGTTAQAVAYLRRRIPLPKADDQPWLGEYTRHDVEEVIIPAYWTKETAVGLDPLLVWAQVLHETDHLRSWWAQRPRRNPAGLGVTSTALGAAVYQARPERFPDYAQGNDGRYYQGLSFASWADHAIPAHLGRLLAYALPFQQARQEQQTLIALALALRPLPAHYRGKSRRWVELNGRWAVPGRTYGQTIITLANSMLR